MVRVPENSDSITVSVYLKNGDFFERKDCTMAPTGEHETLISFWEGDDIVVFPLEQVDRFIYHFDTVKGV